MPFRLLPAVLGSSTSLGIQEKWDVGHVQGKQAVSLAIRLLGASVVRAVQAVSVKREYLGLTVLKLSWMQVLRKRLELENCWKKVKLRFILGVHLKLPSP